MTLFVYDLGGGTFDATLLRLTPGNIQTIATDGDVQLGGHDWDLRLADYVADQFQKAQGIDPRQDPAAMNRVLAAVIDAKHALSARSRADRARGTAGPVDGDSRHPRAVPGNDGRPAGAHGLHHAPTAWPRPNWSWKDISRLLLVGGSTRMPMVVDMLRQLSGIEPDHTVNPDEAVARGAALYAAFLLAKEGGGAQADFTITNVNSHSLGVEGIDPETLRKTNVVLIPRNTPLPAKVTERFVTKSENQRSIVLQVLEGESSLPGECTAIGRTVIHGLPEGLPKNWPVDVTFEYGANGRLTVRAIVPGTQQGAMLNLERAVGMSSDGIARWKKTIDAAAGFDAFESMVQEVLDSSAEAVAIGAAIPCGTAALGRRERFCTAAGGRATFRGQRRCSMRWPRGAGVAGRASSRDPSRRRWTPAAVIATGVRGRAGRRPRFGGGGRQRRNGPTLAQTARGVVAQFHRTRDCGTDRVGVRLLDAALASARHPIALVELIEL